eukprot:scaffold2045_cov404-Prasinococcus_capsulatus_cf.AAC.17
MKDLAYQHSTADKQVAMGGALSAETTGVTRSGAAVLGLTPDAAVCKDNSEECKAWKEEGECRKNPSFMIGDSTFEGHCRLSCGACRPAPKAAASQEDGRAAGSFDLAGPGGGAAAGGVAATECEDRSTHCAEWASGGECERNQEYMIGAEGTEGQCLRSCGVCTERARQGTLQAALFGSGEQQQQQPEAAQCEDKGSHCAEWAAGGECERNREYMIGGEGYIGQCLRSCGACTEGGRQGTLQPLLPGSAVQQTQQTSSPRSSGARMELRWPQKQQQPGQICVGLTTLACTRGIISPAVHKLTPDDRSITPGVGGPTGCREAW